jgi:hypothetical protein
MHEIFYMCANATAQAKSRLNEERWLDERSVPPVRGCTKMAMS